MLSTKRTPGTSKDRVKMSKRLSAAGKRFYFRLR
jgi:hypothetical protein